jgi:hypothetical protein
MLQATQKHLDRLVAAGTVCMQMDVVRAWLGKKVNRFGGGVVAVFIPLAQLNGSNIRVTYWNATHRLETPEALNTYT